MTELKNKQLPTFGTNQERRDRLKKAYGIQPGEFNYDGNVNANGNGYNNNYGGDI